MFKGAGEQTLTVSLEPESITDSAFDTNPMSELPEAMDDDTEQCGLHIGEDDDEEVRVIKSEDRLTGGLFF